MVKLKRRIDMLLKSVKRAYKIWIRAAQFLFCCSLKSIALEGLGPDVVKNLTRAHSVPQSHYLIISSRTTFMPVEQSEEDTKTNRSTELTITPKSKEILATGQLPKTVYSI